MTEGLIAVRRNLTPGAVFFRQRGLTIEYSLDKVTWYFAYELNSTTTGTDGNVDLLRDIDKLIDKYSRKYYRDLDFKALINIDVTVTTRNEAINNPPERAYNPLRMCKALEIFMKTMRSIGKGIQNGGIEIDDIDRFSDTLLTWIYGDAQEYDAPNVWLSIIHEVSVVSFEIWDAFSFAWTSVLSSWTDEQIEEYTCCIYNELESGEFNFSEFVTAGETCAIGAWDEIATPQIYAGFVSLVAYGDLPTDKCLCEDCILYLPTDGNITRGVVSGNTLITQNYTVSGALIRMGSRVDFTIPNMVITDIRILTGMTPYENISDPATPRVQLIVSGGGGFTNLLSGTNWTQLDPAGYPLVPVDTFTLVIDSSTCSSCTTAQRAVYDTSFASLIFVIVCGILS